MLITTWRDPYGQGFNTTKPKKIDIESGLTVLVGCNGAGKSTLLLNIQEHCKIITFLVIYMITCKKVDLMQLDHCFMITTMQKVPDL